MRRLSGETMGTVWSLAIAGDSDVGRIVRDMLAQVISETSLWEADSEISRFNCAPAGTKATLSPGFREVLRTAIAVSEASSGAFDPTLGRLSDHWGFGPSARAATGLPPAVPGWKQIVLVEDQLLQPGNLALDLNAIAKGQAVDRVSQALLDAGKRHFLFGIGGEYRGAGVRPDGQPWWVEIEQPPGAALAPLRVALSGLSIATSGDYRRAFHRDGRRISHSIDPRSGHPIAEHVASVSVIGESCMLADAQATAITVLGAEEGFDWAVSQGLAAQLLLRENGAFRERLTPALEGMLA